MKHLTTRITLILLATFLVACHLSAIGQMIQNDVFWKDTSGNPIYSQGGGVLKVGNTYYWYGARYRGARTYYNNPYSGKNSDSYFEAITCYSSTDLANWKFEGDVMTPADGLQAGWVGRIGCAYNANTRKYVLIAQMYPGLAFGTSSTPTGRFTLAATQSTITNVVNGMTGDQSVFTDDDGQAYLAYCNVEGRSNQYISRLRPSDYLYVEPATRIYGASSGREGNVLFKHKGTYYFITSDLHGWNTSRTYCATASNIWGPYSSEFVMQGSQHDYSHVTQSGLAVTVNGSSGSFVIYGGDRWADFAGNGVGYNQWVPISFNGTTPIFNSLSQWNINAAAGTWSVGSGNNYILNPNFEADRIDVSTVTGWTNSITSGSNPNGNLQSSHNPGRFCLEQWSSSAYQASMYQIRSVPNGTYTLKAWVRSSGGQSTAHIYVKNYGGTQRNSSINSAISTWREITISDINVTNGSIEVGVFSNAGGGQWVNVDDFSLIGNGSPCTPTTITPYVQIDGGTWNQTSTVSITAGQTVKFGPNPVTGGSWSWTGCGTSGSAREQTISPTSSCTATATYTNSCGAQSSQTFTVTVQGSPTTITIQENTTGFCSLNGTIDTNNAGFTGTGFANTNNAVGAGVVWRINASASGNHTLTWRHSNGSGANRPARLLVNGTQVVSSIAFNATTDWTSWADVSVSVNLSAGQNTIRLESTTAAGTSNIDYLRVTGNNPTAVSCSGVTARTATSEVAEQTMDDEKAVDVYPNPATSVITITLPPSYKDGEKKVGLADVNGKTVVSEKIHGRIHTMNIGNLPAGMYILKIENNKKLVMKKVIKK